MRFGIVHHDNVAHARSSGAAANGTAIEDQNLETRASAFGGAGSAHDSGADDYDVKGLTHVSGRSRVLRHL